MIGAAFFQPGRAIPAFRSAGVVFGPSALDSAIGAYRQARDACDYTDALSRAYRKLGAANKMRPENRRACRAAAMREINAIRAQRRQAWARRDRAETALYAAGSSAAVVDAMDAAPGAAESFMGVSIADDPDFAGAGWLS